MSVMRSRRSRKECAILRAPQNNRYRSREIIPKTSKVEVTTLTESQRKTLLDTLLKEQLEDLRNDKRGRFRL